MLWLVIKCVKILYTKAKGGGNMKRQIPSLCFIEHNEAITEETHYNFLFHLQSAVLLALRERGRLNATQHRRAEEMLKQQCLARAKNILEKEVGR